MANSQRRNWKAQLRNAADDAVRQRAQEMRARTAESMQIKDAPAPLLNRAPIRAPARIDQDRDS